MILNSKSLTKNKKDTTIDEYLKCISYCDVHPKGIDYDCESICKGNYFQTKQRGN